MGVDWLQFDADGRPTDATRRMMILDIIVTAEAQLFPLGLPDLPMAERLKRILGAAQNGQLSPQRYAAVWGIMAVGQEVRGQPPGGRARRVSRRLIFGRFLTFPENSPSPGCCRILPYRSLMRHGSVAHDVRPSNGGIAWPARPLVAHLCRLARCTKSSIIRGTTEPDIA
jgi:hypothetical protein